VTEEEDLAREEDLRLRRMRQDDLPLMVRWRNEPHVRAWWKMDGDPVPYTLDDAREEYGPDLEPGGPSTPAIILAHDGPVGYVQWYRWAEYPDEVSEVGLPTDAHAFGLDILIGEPDAVGNGVGSATVDLVCRTLFAEQGATCVALLTAVGNEPAQRAYEKAGLRKVRHALDTDIKDGRRVESWLMIRDSD
jgi:aminoglycoside 6'-N-acetyltransferase